MSALEAQVIKKSAYIPGHYEIGKSLPMGGNPKAVSNSVIF
jgi:hypothetical protein